MKHRLCNECYAATGHTDWCVSKGYAFVGPHPDAPPDTARAPVRTRPVELCCGGTRNRAGCEYHDPSLQPKPAYEVYDWSKRAAEPIPAWARDTYTEADADREHGPAPFKYVSIGYLPAPPFHVNCRCSIKVDD